MALLKLRSAKIILIEDDANKNVLPLLLELVQSKKNIIIFCYEQPIYVWERILGNLNHPCYEEFNPDHYEKYTKDTSTIFIDSINQMALSMGWHECIKGLLNLSSHSNTEQIIMVLHTDCLSHSSKLQIHLNYIASATVSYNQSNPREALLRIKKGNKVAKEILSYDITTSTLKSVPIVKELKQDDEPEKPSPDNLTTFKIEVDQIEKMEKSKLKLPYMSKIHEGESKVYYEPDAVDDWDEEDPDEDLDI